MVTEPTGSPRRRGKPVVLASIAVVVLAVAATLAFRWIGTTDSEDQNPAKPPIAQTTKVVKTTLSGGRLLDGSLGYGQPRPVKGAGQGTITWLPAAGTTVKRGDQLYRVDDSPVSLFYGALPLFRTLSDKDTVGRDVRVVADNLVALGYSIGSQPTVGKVITRAAPTPPAAATAPEPASEPGASGAAKPVAPAPQPTEVTVRDGDAVLTSSLIAAIKEWQRDMGMPATGVLEPGDITVQGGEMRVDTVNTQTGDPVATSVMNVTPTAKVITVQVEAAEASGIVQGGTVSVTLPDGRVAAGKVTAVGTALAAPDGDSPNPDTKPKLAVTVTLDDIAVVANLDSASLKVEFPSETHENVLAVPVGALVALSEGGYGVQLAGGQLVAVQTSLFAKGLVEITGAGIAEGTTVVTTS